MDSPSSKLSKLKVTWPLYLLPFALFLALFFFYPLISGILVSLQPEGAAGFSLANYYRFFTDKRLLRSLTFTAFDLGFVATGLSLLIAIPITYKLRKPFRGITPLRTLITLPLSFSGLIACSLLVFNLGPMGMPNLIFLKYGIIGEPLSLMHSYTGLIIASVFQQVPFIFLFLLSAMAGIDPSVEEAAKTLGANSWQVFRRVIFPLVFPSIVVVALLGYITNYGCFVTALICGEPVSATRTIVIEAQEQAFRYFNWSMAITISMIAAAVEAVFIVVFLRIQKKMLIGGGAYGGATAL